MRSRCQFVFSGVLVTLASMASFSATASDRFTTDADTRSARDQSQMFDQVAPGAPVSVQGTGGSSFTSGTTSTSDVAANASGLVNREAVNVQREVDRLEAQLAAANQKISEISQSSAGMTPEICRGIGSGSRYDWYGVWSSWNGKCELERQAHNGGR